MRRNVIVIRIEQMIKANRGDCVGCYACYNSCPVQAITMQEDKEGFRYPQVNAEACIRCGACERACPSLNLFADDKNIEPDAYAAINQNEKIRAQSSSGGIFQLLAESVLKTGGIVFGAGFDTNWEVHHESVDKIEDLEKLRVSKYLQSRIEDTYQAVKKELRTGREVLFVGTPCQAAGLRTFLKKNYDNLTVADFICHGVPSPAVWREYVQEKTVDKSQISRISFRNKNLSWERYLLVFFFKNTNKYLFADLNTDLYLRGFLRNLYLRPSCHQCKFCKKNRPVDITLADFWGVKEEVPEMYDGKGTSLIFAHTDKGRKFIQQMDARKKKVDFMSGVRHNPSMLHSSMPSPKREAFFQEFAAGQKDVCSIIAKYTKPPLNVRVKNQIKRIPGVMWAVHKIKNNRG